MNDDEPALADALGRLAPAYRPPGGWRERVWAQVDGHGRPVRRLRVRLVIAAAMVTACALFGALWHRNSELDRSQQQILLRENEAKLRQAQEERERTLKGALAIKKEIDQLDAELRSAKTPAEREAIQQKMARVRERQRSLATAVGRPTTSIQLGDDDNDPLKGL